MDLQSVVVYTIIQIREPKPPLCSGHPAAATSGCLAWIKNQIKRFLDIALIFFFSSLPVDVVVRIITSCSSFINKKYLCINSFSVSVQFKNSDI